MQTDFERNMTKKAADPDDMEVSCWSPMDVSYGYIETVGGFKFYSMTNWLINLTLGRAHPGFESFMLGLDEISYSLHFTGCSCIILPHITNVAVSSPGE